MIKNLRKLTITLFLVAALLPLSAQNNYTLQKSLQTAKSNNPSLRTEYLNIGIAQTTVITARLRPNPVLNNQSLQLINLSYFPSNTSWYYGKNRQIWWQLTKPLQIAGQRKYKIDVANKNVDLAQKNYAESERNLFADVANKWIEIWASQKELNNIQIAKTNIDSLVTMNKERLKNRVITQTDLFRTELLAKQYAIQYEISKQQLSNEKKELQFLLGIKDSIDIDTSDNLTFDIKANIDSLIHQSLQYRPDIQTAKSLIEVSNSNIKLQKSLAYPQPEMGFIYNPQNTIPYLGFYGTLKLPFFDRNQGEIKKSVLINNQAEQQLLIIKNKLLTEISTAYSSYVLQRQNVQSFRLLLEQSQTILNNVKYSYLAGGTTIIDFLEAQRSWLDTQKQYYEAIRQFGQSYVQVIYTTGLISELAVSGSLLADK